ncbi:hydrogenase formation protein HypD [Puniceicoccales bacterium CK1056]|uniref:Hydrogenase formation protein HypD n=1 Tax=Oceanipulchritudo coccoides TaxID=2706888 RepID=A0A6B2M3U4_9BACT|nr:hydrogenase formation protein HypD [Oceanipulchritudo coccoides]NDV63086.1 hydrogenase formation protein HypD [Oceanipulchritudo coccoides]
MKFVDEYRDAGAVKKLAEAIHKSTHNPWTIMEICGGQTHSIVKFGIDQLLPEQIRLVHGPGCPVCVTPVALIDAAIHLARQSGTSLFSFGDMLRVPGSDVDLLTVKAEGADVRLVYSPLDAVAFAAQNPDREVVFFAVGFETTAPANAMAALQAKNLGLENFSLLVSHVTVPPAIEAILSSPDNEVQGFLAAGHVCTVMGTTEYPDLASKFEVPIVVTGFEPVDILKGILRCVQLLEAGEYVVDNAYKRAVQEAGNAKALQLMREVFKPVDRDWRGIGTIPKSGLALREEMAQFDAAKRFILPENPVKESPECISGLIMRGAKKPHECPAFGKNCTPDRPLGAPMVSNEGACAAYYRYRLRESVSQ